MTFRSHAAAVVLAAVAAFGVPASCAAEARTPELEAVISQVNEVQKTLQSFRARVKQKKYFSDLGDEVTFLGNVAYARPRQMRWEFTSPDPSTLLIKPNGIWLTVPGIKQVQKIGAQAQGKAGAFFLGFERPLSDMEKDYRLEWGGTERIEQGDTDMVKLFRPNDPFASEVWIWFDSARHVPVRVRWSTAQGDVTTTDFLDIRLNEKVDEKTFDVQIPPGYETVIAEEM